MGWEKTPTLVSSKHLEFWIWERAKGGASHFTFAMEVFLDQLPGSEKNLRLSGRRNRPPVVAVAVRTSRASCCATT